MNVENLNENKFFRTNMKSRIARSGIYIIFVLLIIVFALSNKMFFTINNLLIIIQQASPFGIAVVGAIFVMIVAGIDISVASNMYLVASIGAMMIKNSVIVNSAMMENGIGYLILYPLAMVIGCGIGLLNGVLVTKFKLQPFIATLSIGSVIRGIGFQIAAMADQPSQSLASFSNFMVGPIPLVFLLFIGVIIVFDLILRRSIFGRHILAIGNSPKAAQIAGIKINKNIITCYVIAGILGAVTGLLLAGQTGAVPIVFAQGNEFIVISAAVLGGTSLFGGKGTIFPGAIIGIMLITIIMNGLAMVNASPYIYTIVRAIIIFLAVMLDSINSKSDLR
jgi:ribose/xylose/arabinose/galactoside ABC-type transport system permease subunit